MGGSGAGSAARGLLKLCALCEMTNRRCGRGALGVAGRPRGRPRCPARLADLLSFLFSINNQTRTIPFSSDISTGYLQQRLRTGTLKRTARCRRLKTANTRRLTRAYVTLFYEILKYRVLSPQPVTCPMELRPNETGIDSLAKTSRFLQVKSSRFVTFLEKLIPTERTGPQMAR